MNLASVIQAAGALREARRGDGLGLEDPCVADCLARLFPAEQITLCELDWRHRRARLVGLAPAWNAQGEEIHDEDEDRAFWEHFWPTVGCSYIERIPRLRHEVMMTEDFYSARQWHSTSLYTDYLGPGGIDKSLIMPLPGPPGIARRLVFFRGPGPSFTDQHRSAATLLQPHIADVLRLQARRAATRSLTARQRELLQLVAAGHHNRAIARQLGAIAGHRPQAPGEHLRQARRRQPHRSNRRNPPRLSLALKTASATTTDPERAIRFAYRCPRR
ncbi:MAG TPA: hypothetical protein VH589_25515 [Trebonia sp.]|jgi:hypothetical protein